MRSLPQTPAPGCCRVIERNDVLGTNRVFDTPQTADEAIQDHGDVVLASHFAKQSEYDDTDLPIECSFRHNDDLIIIHWHATGDIQTAREVMRRILAGEARSDLDEDEGRWQL